MKDPTCSWQGDTLVLTFEHGVEVLVRGNTPLDYVSSSSIRSLSDEEAAEEEVRRAHQWVRDNGSKLARCVARGPRDDLRSVGEVLLGARGEFEDNRIEEVLGELDVGFTLYAIVGSASLEGWPQYLVRYSTRFAPDVGAFALSDGGGFVLDETGTPPEFRRIVRRVATLARRKGFLSAKLD